MATDATKVGVAVAGAVFKGLTSATAPVGTTGAPTGFTDLGFLGEDGIEIELPDAGDTEPIKSNDGVIVRVIRTPSEDNPTWTFAMLETRIATIETYFGVTVTSTATEGSFQFRATDYRPYNSYIVDAIDGAELLRDYIPRGVVTEVDAHKLVSSEATLYEVTVEGELDPVKNYNFKRWATRLKTGS